MALTHRILKRIALPHEDGQWIEVRMPSFNILERAREARSRKAIALVAGIDLGQIKGPTEAPERTIATEYDRLTILQACCVAWSYGDPVTAENIAELDEATIAVIIAELLPSETEDERKKDCASSTRRSNITALRPLSG